MNLKEISDEELVDDVNDYDQYNDDKIQELKDRLERGRKAIEFASALIKHRNGGVDLESGGRIYNWLDQYEGQLKEETPDEN